MSVIFRWRSHPDPAIYQRWHREWLSYGENRGMLKDPNNWARLAPYLDQALDLVEDERTTWLQQLERTDSETARDLRILLGELENLHRVGYLEDSPLQSEGMDALMPALLRMV